MSEASLRAAIPPHFSKESPCWGIYSNLRGISAKLDTIGAAKTHTVEDLAHYRQMLNAIDSARGAGGIFAGHIDHDDPAKTVIPDGQAVCSDELASAFAKLEALTDSAAPISGRASELLSRLKGIRQHLEAAQRERAAPEDLKPLQEELDAIDAERLAHGGVFAGDVKGGHIPPGQAVLSETLAQCYRLVQSILQRSEQ